MLKIKTGVVIEGDFDSKDFYLPTIKESEFSTLILNVQPKDFDAKCYRITSDLADEGIMYGRDYVIARKSNES